MSASTNDLTATRLQSTDLQELAERTANPCVSIYMQTHRSGPETQQGAIRFKNLLGQATKQLKQASHDRSILDPIESLSTNSDFWQHQGEGLAIFLTPDDCRLIQLDRTVEDHVSIGESFSLLPLVRKHNASDNYFVLSLTWEEAKLFRSDGVALEVFETKTLPAKFQELVLPRDPEPSLQNTSHRSTGNTSTAMFHGQGEGEDKIQADRNQYLSLVGDQVSGAFYNTRSPLVLVATTEVAGQFEAMTNVPIAARVQGSPSQWSDDDLRVRVQEAVATELNASSQDYFERFGTALSRSKGSDDISEILQAAENGRVESVMICDNTANTDHVNTIVLQTLRHGGEVCRCDAEQMPNESCVAAMFRV